MGTRLCTALTFNVSFIKMDLSSQEIISQLGLVPLKFEGGWVREFGKSPSGLSSSIYYMIQAGDITQWHRVGVDEYWCHHSGDNIRIRTLTQDGQYSQVILGQLSSVIKMSDNNSWCPETPILRPT